MRARARFPGIRPRGAAFAMRRTCVHSSNLPFSAPANRARVGRSAKARLRSRKRVSVAEICVKAFRYRREPTWHASCCRCSATHCSSDGITTIARGLHETDYRNHQAVQAR
ncbi:pilL domain protein [Burkholderia pseudomallei MSHR456]|nr:pilL domain protein [Burkholderia pseudomallei MSHR456]